MATTTKTRKKRTSKLWAVYLNDDGVPVHQNFRSRKELTNFVNEQALDPTEVIVFRGEPVDFQGSGATVYQLETLVPPAEGTVEELDDEDEYEQHVL